MSKPGSVTVVLVSHAGMAWLPQVLDGIDEQSHPVERVVATDTGSRDGGFELLQERLGSENVAKAGRGTSYGSAVNQALELDAALHPGNDTEWIWLLHDDSRPDPGALRALLARSEAGADLLGPKLREWPSLRRLLEVGVTISPTGRRETGLERGEYDQGQHDSPREVLAVNTAGLLIRRTAFDALGGIDPALPIFGNDIDLGWRAANAGLRTEVVPEAVVFHAEAAHRGIRRTSLTGNHTHYQERRAALFTLLANARGRSLWWLVPRLAFGTLLRVVGFLMLRSVGEALDELAALVAIYARPGSIIAARRSRKKRAVAPAVTTSAVVSPKSLLAPWWTPYRHGLDYLSDVAAALGNQAQDVAERRRLVAIEESGLRPTSPNSGFDEDDDYVPESGWLVRFVTSPVALGITLALVVLLGASWPAWSALSGGALSPAPAGGRDWWNLWIEQQHALGLGSDRPAPAYVAVLALPAMLIGAPATISMVLILAMPLALWGMYRLLRVLGKFGDPLGTPRWLLGVGAVGYATLPAVSGAWADGRLGPVVVTALLPWWGHAALGFADPEPDRRWRAAFRSGLLLALMSAFAGGVYLVALLVTLVVLGAAVVYARSLVADRSVSLPALVALIVPLVLWLPWWLPLLQRGQLAGLLLEPGRLPVAAMTGSDLLLGRLADGADWWWSVPVLVAAVASLFLARSRVAGLASWSVVAVAVSVATVVSLVSFSVGETSIRLSATGVVPWVWAALIVAGVGFGDALTRSAGAGRGWRALGLVLGIIALAVPVASLVIFASQGSPAFAEDSRRDDIPAYMTQASELGSDHGVLIVRGSVEDGLRYIVRRGDGMTIGEDEASGLTPTVPAFSELVQRLASRPTPDETAGLAAAGVQYVVMSEPVDSRVAATLDAASGLAQASAANRATRAWQVTATAPESTAVPHAQRSTGRTVLVLAQIAVLVVLLVLSGPSRRREEER